MSIDNRVPGPFGAFVGPPHNQDTISFLSFEDWLAKCEPDAKDWIPVAKSWRTSADDQFTFSVLAAATEGALEQMLSTHKWEVMVDFDQPSFLTPTGNEDDAVFNAGSETSVDGIRLSSFTIHRFFHGYVPTTFELTQGFLLYSEAFFVQELGEHQRIDPDGNIHSVARLIRDGDNHAILVDAHHLRDYLAARKSYLVRYHDHRRWAAEDITAHIGGEFLSRPVEGERRRFDLWLRTDIPREGFPSASRLVGKDVVIPYPNSEQSPHWPFSQDREKEYVSFIIGRDDQGNHIQATCSEEGLSNYFVNRGTPHFLTPAFFRREVLSKYYGEPRRYSVSDGTVACLSLWSIPIDITAEDLVQVWLGDLGRIPYAEQLHWRQFNIAPRGTITRHRWLRDFMAEFADPDNDPIYSFHVGFEAVQRAALERYDAPFFRGLTEGDAHAYETLHVPLTEEWNEFDAQIQALAKIAVDSLNADLLASVTGKKIDGSLIKGSLDLLADFLNRLQASEEDTREILGAFHAVQAVRSTGAAHRKGENFENALKRYQLENMSNRARARKLVMDLAAALPLLANRILAG